MIGLRAKIPLRVGILGGICARKLVACTTTAIIAVGFTSSPAQAMTSPAAMISLLDQPKLIHASLYFRRSPHTYGPYYDYAYRPFWKYRTPSLRYRCGCCC